jgi:hypothetical protein
MKPLYLLALVSGIFFLGYNNSVLAAETKKVCVEQTDPKTKKPKEVCKNVKVHEKLEGTKVPPKAPK